MINPSWPYIVAISFFVACGYAVLVAWLNNHPRYGEFWRQHEWIEVVIGSLLVAVTVWALAGLQVFLIVLGVYVVFGAPMIAAVLVADMRRVARERDERIAQG
jgi:ABC-type spermidine/putrescine transport system permease subunit II